MVIPVLRKIIMVPALLFLSGCATLYNPATGKNEVILIHSQTEAAIGKNVSLEITKKQAVVVDKGFVDRVGMIGARLSAVSDRKDVEYRFYVLADKELNAVSLPGGYIYVNKGLMDVLDNDELAFVIGHEIGHVAARHAVKKIQATMAYQMLLSLAFSGMGNSAGTNAQNIASSVDMAYNLIQLGYSREDEYLADKLGAKYVFKAGFNPSASLTALGKLKKGEGAGLKVLGYLRTHPYVDDRIKALKTYIPELTGMALH
jgi:predicted Zn-dependent protease